MLSDIETSGDGKINRVKTISVDDLCEQKDINKIRYLKFDIEGAELVSLKGASKMLGSKGIDYILVESMFNESSRGKS